MSPNRTPCAVVSTNPRVLEAVRLWLRDCPSADVILEIPEGPRLADEKWRELGQSGAGVVFLDLDAETDAALTLARRLADSESSTAVTVGIASDPDAGLLLCALRAGLVDVVKTPECPDALRSSLERIAGRSALQHDAARPEGGRVTAVVGTGKGAGATTVCATLGLVVARLGRTLVVDLDLERGDLDLHLGLEPEYGVTDALREAHRLDDVLLEAYAERHPAGVELLAAPSWPDASTDDLGTEKLGRLLTVIRRHYDHALLDLSSGNGLVACAALEDADEVLIVATADVPGVRNLCRLLKRLEKLRAHAEPGTVRIVVNRFEDASPLSMRDVAETAGREVLAVLRLDRKLRTRAVADRRPLRLDGHLAFVADVRCLAEQLTGIEAPVAERSGWWTRLISWASGSRRAGALTPSGGVAGHG